MQFSPRSTRSDGRESPRILEQKDCRSLFANMLWMSAEFDRQKGRRSLSLPPLSLSLPSNCFFPKSFEILKMWKIFSFFSIHVFLTFLRGRFCQCGWSVIQWGRQALFLLQGANSRGGVAPWSRPRPGRFFLSLNFSLSFWIANKRCLDARLDLVSFLACRRFISCWLLWVSKFARFRAAIRFLNVVAE